MMVTPLYMLFQFRYVKEGYSYGTHCGYLFYNPLERKLYELPESNSRAMDRAEWEHPLRFLEESTPLDLSISINTPYEFAHKKAKPIREALEARHLGGVKLIGWGNVMRVVHDENEICYHGRKWMDKGEPKNGVYDIGIWEMTNKNWLTKYNHYRFVRNITHERFLTNHLQIQYTYLWTPTMSQWTFCDVDLFGNRPTPIFGIREILVSIDKWKGQGTIHRWSWHRRSGQRVLYRNVSVKATAEHKQCQIEGEDLHSVEEIWHTANRVLSIH